MSISVVHGQVVVAALTLFAATQAIAQRRGADTPSTGELALSNDTLQLRYIAGGERVGVDGSRLAGGFFLGEERDIVLSGGLLFPANFGIRRLQIGFGPQAYAALLEDENDDVLALSIGTEVRFFIDPDRLAVSGQAYYSPDIMTFGSGDNLTDLSARVELRVAPELQAFAGMRWFEFDLIDGGGERTLQEEVFVGIGYRF
jgi:hypothetical protein